MINNTENLIFEFCYIQSLNTLKFLSIISTVEITYGILKFPNIKKFISIYKFSKFFI